jgi:hypothetical protein
MKTRSAALCGLLCTALLWVGCSGQRLTEAERPAQEPTMVIEPPDVTIETDVEPLAPEGIETRAVEVVRYRDTTSAPTIDLEALMVDRATEEVTARFRVGDQTIEETSRLPAVGERWWLTVEDLGDTLVTNKEVEGTPRADTVEVVRPEQPEQEDGFWTRVGRTLRLLLAFAGGLVFGVVFGRIFL